MNGLKRLLLLGRDWAKHLLLIELGETENCRNGRAKLVADSVENSRFRALGLERRHAQPLVVEQCSRIACQRLSQIEIHLIKMARCRSGQVQRTQQLSAS